MSERDDDRQRIRDLLATVNQAWTKGSPEDIDRAMSGCFHDKVVCRGPNLETTAVGPEATIASYRAFVQAAEIEACSLGEPQIDLAGDTAIAAYPWTMAYRLEGSRYEDSGKEIVVVTRDEARWLIRWRTIIQGERKER